ncbi:MAG: endolytic transglycosylase MltG [Tannerellaceae bacterium]|jgi:UPF0755 protein|nr:endolytic transglycosylase MltG [Tannerellaceae bacterium]
MKRFLFACIWMFGIALPVGVGCWVYRRFYLSGFANKEITYLYVDHRKDFGDLCRQLVDSAGMTHPRHFIWLANVWKYTENMKTGRYAVTPGMSYRTLLNNLRRGQQSPTRITFHNIRFVEDLAERMDEQLMLGKEELLHKLKDPDYCQALGFTTQTIGALFIPDTYEIYWNIPVENFLQRMKREYDAFWTNERKKKAADIALTPVETAILASIVEEETAATDEYPVVAGLYLNRLRQGIPLQADPTVRFATGNFALQRILFEHLEIDSPYNTYKHTGLPPGLLKLPSAKGIDGVLNHTRHRYIYMCAKEDFSGRHNFAATLAEHNRNANRYRAELNRRNIR